MDDFAFPSYSSSKIKSKRTTIDEIGDCFVRELDFSRITLRIREKGEISGDAKKDKEDIIAKLTGNTLDTLKQCLVGPNRSIFTKHNADIAVEQSNGIKAQGRSRPSMQHQGQLEVYPCQNAT